MTPTRKDLSNLDLRDVDHTDIPPVSSSAGNVAEPDENEAEVASGSRSWGRGFSLAMPAWLVSLLVHVALILFMAAYHIPELSRAVTAYVMSATSADPNDALEEFAISDSMSVDLPETQAEVVPEAAPLVQEDVAEIPVDIVVETLAPSLTSLSLDGLQSDVLSASASSSDLSMKKGLSSRSKDAKRDLLDRYGGNEATEKAVAAALKWLSQHQLPDGSWTFAHGLACDGKCKDNGLAAEARNGATGMALMAFLGAGQTHMEGDYRQTVFKGLAYLLRNMQVTEGKIPSWYLKGRGSTTGVMYSHGIASIAMCEAYGMTKDPDLRAPAQAAINFIVYAQDPAGGGWYYQPRAGGDTSVVGWQLMALKSASMSNLNVPVITLRKAQKYLDAVYSAKENSYGYRKSGDRKTASAMTACGLLCRMYMGIPKDNPSLQDAVKAFVKKGLDADDVYFNYYATQVMKQIGGPLWEEWDQKMKQVLLTTQEKSGHSAGSWFFKGGHQNSAGGRLYTTCMATMMLEVYYRYLPIYGEQSEEEAFKL